MKRILSLVIIAFLTFSLCACQDNSEDAPGFYYPRSFDKDQYNSFQPVIAPDSREPVAGKDLRYLIQLYMEGPVSEELYSPFPEGLRLLGLILEEDCITISLSQEYLSLEGIDLTLAGACLAKTCFSLSDVSRIRVQCGTKIWDYHRSSFLFTDTSETETAN